MNNQEDENKIFEELLNEERLFDEEVKEFKNIMKQNLRDLNECKKETQKRVQEKISKSTKYADEFEYLMKELVDAIECPILFSEMTLPSISPCGHVYEDDAIRQCYRKGLKDPISRASFEENTTRPHYLSKNIIEIINKYVAVTNVNLT